MVVFFSCELNIHVKAEFKGNQVRSNSCGRVLFSFWTSFSRFFVAWLHAFFNSSSVLFNVENATRQKHDGNNNDDDVDDKDGYFAKCLTNGSNSWSIGWEFMPWMRIQIDLWLSILVLLSSVLRHRSFLFFLKVRVTCCMLYIL